MENDVYGCEKWKNSYSTIKELLDYGYLEGECEGCLYSDVCKKINENEEIS